jgi:hypothetical protein
MFNQIQMQQIIALAKQFFPQASDDEVKQVIDGIVKEHPDMGFQEIIGLLPHLVPQIQAEIGQGQQQDPNKAGKLTALQKLGQR